MFKTVEIRTNDRRFGHALKNCSINKIKIGDSTKKYLFGKAAVVVRKN